MFLLVVDVGVAHVVRRARRARTSAPGSGTCSPVRPRSAAPGAALIEHVIGPVWEANHVWLIFVMVLLWTCYPPVFAAIASTLYIPLTLVALGIIGRGAAFAFRKAVTTPAQRRLFGATFAASSLVTPFFLGATAGAIASDRVPPGIARGHVLTSWLTPISMVTGALAVCACAFLAAVYLTREAARSADAELVRYFRRRALASGILTGALSVVGLLVARTDGNGLAHALSGRGLPVVIVSVAAGCRVAGARGDGTRRVGARDRGARRCRGALGLGHRSLSTVAAGAVRTAGVRRCRRPSTRRPSS